MANTRGKDYNKRLNYDELKDKITKTKKPINAPYRTATVIRNSNQMQNLLAMSTLDMEEHQVKLQNEQMKQAKKDEMIKKAQPKSNLPVVSSSAEFYDIADDVIDDKQDTIDLLTESSEEQSKTLNTKNKQDLGETGNMASQLAKISEDISSNLTGGASSSQERTTTPSPSKPPPGEEFGLTPERNVNAELIANQEKASKAKIQTVARIMDEAYNNSKLNVAQTKKWESIKDAMKNIDKSDQSGNAVIEKMIRDEYAVYLSYQSGLFRARSPSKPRGRSLARSEKSPESTHPRSKSRARAKSESTGYDGYNIADLKELAKSKKIKNYSTMRKQELIDALSSL